MSDSKNILQSVLSLGHGSACAPGRGRALEDDHAISRGADQSRQEMRPYGVMASEGGVWLESTFPSVF